MQLHAVKNKYVCAINNMPPQNKVIKELLTNQKVFFLSPLVCSLLSMANRSVYPKLIQSLPCIFRRSSATAIPPLFTDKPETTVVKPATTTTTTTTNETINLDDVKELFSSVSTTKLLKSSITLNMTAFEPLVDMGIWMMNSKLMQTPLVREIIFEGIRHTFYQHFCAGQNLEEVKKTVANLWSAGLGTMLDYGLEHANDNKSCDQNMEDFIQTIETTKALPPSSATFLVVKVTALCPPALLKRVSDLLRWEHKDKSFNLPWKMKSFPIFSESSPLYHTITKPEALTPEEERDLQLGHDRLIKICQKCLELDLPLLIDAEDTSIQPAIDYFTYSASIMYRKDDKPLVFGTIQAYLKDAQERLVLAKQAADKMGIPAGFKLVRGAYMSSERQLASSLGFKSPIHNSIQETHECYNACAEFMLEQIAKGSGSVVLATHNIQSGRLVAAKATDLGIAKDNQNIQFAQLYGMAEALSFGLRGAGFRVSKYLPFGPVEQIMPYLLRRAEENRGLISTSSLDRQLIRKELMRRLQSTIS